MSVKKADLYEHNNEDLAFVDGKSVRGMRRTVADREGLYGLVIKADQLAEQVTVVRIISDGENGGDTTEVLLVDADNIGTTDGWLLQVAPNGGVAYDDTAVKARLGATTALDPAAPLSAIAGSILRVLPLGINCLMYGQEDPFSPNTYGVNGNGAGHMNNLYLFGTNSNNLGDNHSFNTLGSNSYANSFGNDHADNTYGSGCYSNTFADNHRGNTYGNNLVNSVFGADNRYNVVGDDCLDIRTGSGVSECEVGDNCKGITFGANCKNVKVFDTRNGAGGTNANRLSIPANTQNATYRRGLLVTGGSATPGTGAATPFGPLTATGAAGETFPLPVGTKSVRGVMVLDASPGAGQYPVVGLMSAMYTIDATISPPTLTVKAPYTLSAGDIIEGVAFTTASTATPGTGTIVVDGTTGTPGILVLSTTTY